MKLYRKVDNLAPTLPKICVFLTFLFSEVLGGHFRTSFRCTSGPSPLRVLRHRPLLWALEAYVRDIAFDRLPSTD